MHRSVAIIIVLGVALRLTALWFVADTRTAYDETSYYAHAAAMVEGRFFVWEDRRPPLTAWYYAGLLKVFGMGPLVVRIANALASSVTILLAWALGRRFGGDRIGRAAALVVAVYPTLVFFGFSLWSEVLYLPLVLGALLALVAGERRAGLLLLSGVLMGAAALTREVGVMLPVAGGLWLLGRAGFRGARAWISAACLGAGFVMTILPWTVHQNQQTESFTLISQSRWMNLYVGNMPRDPGREQRAMPNLGKYRKLGGTLQEREEAARELALEDIRERLPWWPFEKLAEMIPRLLTPNSLLTQRMLARPDKPGAYSGSAYETRADGTGLEWIRLFFAYLAVASWVALLLAGTGGFALAWGRPLVGIFLLFIGLQILPTIITFSFSRYRVPFLPLLAIAAVWLALEGGAAWRAARTRHRAAVLLSVATAAVVVGLRWWTVIGPHGG
ncbi:MAG TPA: glycosyltransferase family 39 protein [bacterium]|nr:glycosyltransferase family 39 protein [bacterium]